MKTGKGGSREEAKGQAQALLESNLISLVSPTQPPPSLPFKDDEQTRYILVADAPKPTKGQKTPLNTHYWWHGPARPAVQVATDLRQLILDLYERHLSEDGRDVSYKGMSQDPLFAKYVDATAELQRVDISSLSTPELTAFFINLYNALIIHATATYGTAMTTLERVSFFSSVKYNIGGSDYSADDMENGVLRGNRPAASNLWALVGLPGLSGGQFPDKSDPRRGKVVSEPDARVHFALVCGAKSCPPIRLYTPDNLDEGLNAAGEAFCAGEVEVDRPKNEVRISKIFKWYSGDFGSNDVERLKWISKFLKGQAKSDLEAMLNGGSSKIKTRYREYDWAPNSSEK